MESRSPKYRADSESFDTGVSLSQFFFLKVSLGTRIILQAWDATKDIESLRPGALARVRH